MEPITDREKKLIYAIKLLCWAYLSSRGIPGSASERLFLEADKILGGLDFPLEIWTTKEEEHETTTCSD